MVAGMTEAHPDRFEARRFRTAAAHYLSGRAPYSPHLIRRVAELAGLRPDHRVLDLGCGPGPLAVGFAPYAAEVLGVDPEPEMLRAARASGAPANVRFVQGSSADLGPDLGRFHLVTMGRSFHWMDRADTLRQLDGIVEPGGAIALFNVSRLDIPENLPHRDYTAVLRRYAEDDQQWLHRQAPEWVRHEAMLLGSAFSQLERIGVVERLQVTVEQLIDRALSLSSTSRARLGDQADAMVAELRATLARSAPDGVLPEVVESSALLAWRPGD